jgi:hypothetical protein
MTKNKNSHPEGFICEQFAYLPYFGVYPNTSDMDEITKMPLRLNAFGIHILANGWRMSEGLQP